MKAEQNNETNQAARVGGLCQWSKQHRGMGRGRVGAGGVGRAEGALSDCCYTFSTRRDWSEAGNSPADGGLPGNTVGIFICTNVAATRTCSCCCCLIPKCRAHTHRARVSTRQDKKPSTLNLPHVRQGATALATRRMSNASFSFLSHGPA